MAADAQSLLTRWTLATPVEARALVKKLFREASVSKAALLGALLAMVRGSSWKRDA